MSGLKGDSERIGSARVTAASVAESSTGATKVVGRQFSYPQNLRYAQHATRLLSDARPTFGLLCSIVGNLFV